MSVERARLVDGIPDDEYHRDRSRLSGSSLEMFIARRSEYGRWIRRGFETETTPAMAFGRFFHQLVLEPDTFHAGEIAAGYAIEPCRPDDASKCLRRNTTAYKEWEAKAIESGSTIVSRELAMLATPMLERIVAAPEIHEMITAEDGLREQVVYFSLFGRPFRAKLDELLLERGQILELKTDKSADPRLSSNQWEWYRRGYHRKSFIYLEALRQLTGKNGEIVHVIVEKRGADPWLCVRRSYVDSPAVQVGAIEVKRAIEALTECERTGDWREDFEPGGAESDGPLPLPPAIEREYEFETQNLMGMEEVEYVG